MKKSVCMVVQDKMVKGGIAAVISGYYGSELEEKYNITYVESYKDGGKFTKLFKGICGYIAFAKVLILNKPELIHIHSSFGPSFYRKMPFILMASAFKVPIINHIHGADFDVFYRNAPEKKRKMIQRIYNKCHTLIALSEEWKKNLSEIVSEDKITVIENYSVLHKDAMVERAARPSNHTVLFLGELGKRKGCYDIPDIISEVAKQVSDVKFVLAGAGSAEDEDAIKKLLIEKKVIDNVVFPGWVRDGKKDQLLREADIFLLPSYNEGMPMSVLDAMGYGLPIISTIVGGIPKIVHNGRNGYCFQPGESEKMGHAIADILLDEKMSIKMGQRSITIIEEKYSLEAHLAKLESCYDRGLSIGDKI